MADDKPSLTPSRTVSRTRYLGRQPIETTMVKVRAVKRFTESTPRGIFHFDPKGRDPRARENLIPRDVAEMFQGEGKVKIVGDATATLSGPTPAQRAVELRDQSAPVEEAVLQPGAGLTGADTRDTTAFEQNPADFARSVSGVEDITSNQDMQASDAQTDDQGMEVATGGDAPPADDGDDDTEAAPASSGRRRPGKPKAS